MVIITQPPTSVQMFSLIEHIIIDTSINLPILNPQMVHVCV